jgi:hypothetical protein
LTGLLFLSLAKAIKPAKSLSFAAVSHLLFWHFCHFPHRLKKIQICTDFAKKAIPLSTIEEFPLSPPKKPPFKPKPGEIL